MVGVFYFHLSRVPGSVADDVKCQPQRMCGSFHTLRDAHKVYALTKVGTVLKGTAGLLRIRNLKGAARLQQGFQN